MLYWINFLHIYQPPTQEPETVKKVTQESYFQILELLETSKQAKMTLNIPGSLLEKLQENQYSALIERLKSAISRGQLELTGSAMYHPILPLIPPSEVKEQIKLNNKKNQEIFGELFKPAGFYFPEMAYSVESAKIVKEFGFKWIILDEIHFPDGPLRRSSPPRLGEAGSEASKPDNSIKYEIEDIGMMVVFRDRKYSKNFPPRLILENLQKLDDKYLITAHDGELYGHWHKDYDKFLNKILAHKDIDQMNVSEYLSELKNKVSVTPREISWETTEEEIKKNIPYALWNDPDNKIHQELWKMSREVYNLLQDNQDDPNYKWAKIHYSKGISSCFWWWASERKVDVFSPVSWNPTIIEQGATELLKALRSLHNLPLQDRLKAEDNFNNFRSMVWKRHWVKLSEKP